MNVALVVIAILALVLALFLIAAIKVAREYERGIVFRLGRLLPEPKGPGLFLLIPVVDRMVKVDLRTITLTVPPQEVITKDNVPVRVNAVAYFRIVAPKDAIVQIENFMVATSQIAQTTLRSVLGQHVPGELASCPFCAGHEDMTPPQTLVLPEQGDWKVRVVPNLYPALERQEVVVHSRRHIRSIAEAEDDELELVAEAWRRRAEAEPGYVFPLLNEGREAGASLAHSHSQLAWLPEPPPPRARPRAVETVLEKDGVAATCPWAGRVPYETVIAPTEAEIDGLESSRLPSALKLLAEVVRRLQ